MARRKSGRKIKEERRQGYKIWTRKIEGPLTTAEFSPSMHLTVLGFEDGWVQLIDAEGKEVWTSELDIPITHLRLMEDKKRIVVLDEHSKLTFLDLTGRVLKYKNFKTYWSSFEIKSNQIILWGWHEPPLKLDAKGNELGTLGIPKPWRVVRAIRNQDLYFVIHNQIALGLYSGSGTSRFVTNHPVPIDLSRERPSEVAASDSGNMIAVACFEKGVFVYDGPRQSMKHIELDYPVDHIAVSADGTWLLIADAMGELFLVNEHASIIWHDKLAHRVYWMRLDKEGNRALIIDMKGNLTCVEFADSDRTRSEFLEMGDYQKVANKQELWQKPYSLRTKPSSLLLKMSDDGGHFLLGEGKRFTLFDSQGNTVWSKGFMQSMDDGWLSSNGSRALMCNHEILFFKNLYDEEGDDDSLSFYKDPIREIGMDPEEGAFLIYHRSGAFSYYSGEGKKVWRRTLKQKVQKIRMSYLHKCAVFQGMNRTVYIMMLADCKVKRVTLPSNIIRLRTNPSSIFVACEDGSCYGLTYQGKIRWQHQEKKEVREIIPLHQGVGFRTEGGRVTAVQDDGVVLGDMNLRHARSVLHYNSPELLELVPEEKSLVCYHALKDQVMWKADFAHTLSALAVSQHANRAVVLASDGLHAFAVTDQAEDTYDRHHFLEF